MTGRGNSFDSQPSSLSGEQWYRLSLFAAGAFMVCSAGILWMGQQLNIRWIEYAVLLLVGLIPLVIGWVTRCYGALIAGCLCFGTGAGLAALLVINDLDSAERLSLFFGLFGLGLVLFILINQLLTRKIAWWALILLAICVGLGIQFSGLVKSVIAGAGIELLLLALVFGVWAFVEKDVGFVIASGNLAGVGVGALFAWSDLFAISVLSKVGVFLIGFSLGWVLITLFSNFSGVAVLWWALIPAGVMGIVGWGLYIGGRPGFSAEVIGNVGSIVLIAIGLYLLLLRSGMRK